MIFYNAELDQWADEGKAEWLGSYSTFERAQTACFKKLTADDRFALKSLPKTKIFQGNNGLHSWSYKISNTFSLTIWEVLLDQGFDADGDWIGIF